MEEVVGDPRERHSGTSANDELMNRGAISQLQEFVQGAKLYPMPPNCSVLQWEYETRASGASLNFRATVAFLLDGVPHHSVGTWKPSKKLAQRDAAERALGLFVNRWGELAVAEQRETAKGPGPGPSSPSSRSAGVDLRARLEEFCERLMPHVSLPLHWSHRWEGGGGKLCQAFVEISMLEVVHTFPGRPRTSVEAAYADVAHRVLWYVQAPGFEDAFEPDSEYVRAAAQTIPEPATCWVRAADSEGEGQHLTERCTDLRLRDQEFPRSKAY